ncbi:MFS transporter [Fervidobacterium sp. 2310opik-2]|uniref:MFS transporter n=1 Tax=Fervidobacterium sp. 2310opik-2 TaxID=1755815 RepID=UPI0013E08518|nr:MFS transporter [Fervidobacterium sp. 2310opik-2]KAF2962186.1 MFS transporter [Fervidobacterium sp. 2310opik-2]
MENLLPMFIIFSYSLVLNSMAPLLKSFKELFEISTFASSLLPFFSLTGTVLSNILVGLYINKLGLKRSLIIGSILTIIGTITVAFGSNYYITLLGMFVFGLSTGFGFTGGTTLLSTSKKANFGFFHGAYGLGGVIAPFVIILVEKSTGNFKNVYFVYSAMFILFSIYAFFRTFPDIKTDTFKLTDIKFAFNDKSFAFFLTLLILYSSAEIGTITWAGTSMKQEFINSFMAYTLFWSLFTIGRFTVNLIAKFVGNLVRINTFTLAIIIILFILTKHPVLFVLSGLFLGPIFPYVQSNGIKSINQKYIPIFNGATYAFTSLGGNIVSTTMGIVLDKSIFIAWLIPLTIVLIIFILSRKCAQNLCN